MIFGRGMVYEKGYLMHITGPSQFEGPDNVVRRAKTRLVNWWAPQRSSGVEGLREEGAEY